MYKHFVSYYNQIFSFDASLKDELKPYLKNQGYAVDLGCGTGRLVNLFDSLGMNSMGVDLDRDMILKAQEDYPSLSFKQDNMVDFLDQDQSFDLITCFGNTIPHLDEDMLKRFFMLAHKRLNKHGYLLVQLLNYEMILEKKPSSLKEIIIPEGKFERFYDYHGKTITFTTKLTTGHYQSQGSTTLYPYTKHDLELIFLELKLKYKFVTHFHSDNFDQSASHLSIIIQK